MLDILFFALKSSSIFIIGSLLIYWVNGRNIVMRFVIFAIPLVYIAVVIVYTVHVVFKGAFWPVIIGYATFVVLAFVALELLGRFLMRSILRNLRHISEMMKVLSAETVLNTENSSDMSQSYAHQADEISNVKLLLDQMNESSKENIQLINENKSVTSLISKMNHEVELSSENVKSAMEKLDKNTTEIAKIVQSIQSIAFQTNLLALNASVEAARAGTAGTGFAVVAEEVRNLANKATDEAKTTQEIINRNIRDIHEGNEAVQKMSVVFGELNQHLNNTQKLAGLVANQSGKQTEWIRQGHQGLNTINPLVQKGVKNAEEMLSDNKEIIRNMASLQVDLDNLYKIIRGFSGRKK